MTKQAMTANTTVQIALRVPAELHHQFRIATAMQRTNSQAVLQELIGGYIERFGLAGDAPSTL